jgi:hypothetical protein
MSGSERHLVAECILAQILEIVCDPPQKRQGHHRDGTNPSPNSKPLLPLGLAVKQIAASVGRKHRAALGDDRKPLGQIPPHHL